MTAITELGVKAIRDGVAAGEFTAREAAEDGVLLRKFVYRVAPKEGLTKIEPVVKRITAPPRAGIELRIFGYFVLPLVAILIALLGLLVRSFPGPGDLEVIELTHDQPLHVVTDRIHRSPDGTWSTQGLSLVEDPRHAAVSFTLSAREPELTGVGLDSSGLDPRDKALLAEDLDGVRRAIETATDTGSIMAACSNGSSGGRVYKMFWGTATNSANAPCCR